MAMERFELSIERRIDAPVERDWQPHGPFMVGLFEVAADGDGALYRGTARHWSREAMDQHRAMGFESGWGAAADQLKALAEGTDA